MNKVPTDQLSDETLLAGLGTGDHQAALAFVRRFQSKVFGIAVAVVHDVALAEDVAQKTFEKAWKHASMYDPVRGSVQAWMTTITRNLAIDALRVRVPTPIDPHEMFVQVINLREGPEQLALADDASVRLREALRQLPVDQAHALVLAAFGGMTATEIATAENLPLGTVKSRIRSAMAKLRKALDGMDAEVNS